MTPREIAAYNAGIQAVRHAALIAAVSIETRPNAGEVRHRAAVAALHGLAEGARALTLSDHDNPQQAGPAIDTFPAGY